MIPLRLELTNFLSYRDTAVLELQDIHLACVSGLNGAGKSSILDGITWALFGRSRSKSDDDLVNRLAALAGDGTEVRLVFALEGGTYRIIRRKKPRGRELLELQIEAGADLWKTLSESGTRETQAAIESLLRMNYDTFINASFLLQGKADEFTTKTPDRRKEILADLLGVSRWEIYREAATNWRKEAEGQTARLEGLLEEIALELAEEGERKEVVAQAQAELEVIGTRVADKEALLQQLRRTEAAVTQQEQMVKNLVDNLARAEASLARLRQLQQQRQGEREGYQAILDRSSEIVADFVAWQEAEKQVNAWQASFDTYSRLQQAQRPHELAVAQARSRLEQRQRELEAQAERAREADEQRQLEEATLEAGNSRLRQIDATLVALRQQEQAWHEARASLQQLENDRKLFAQESSQLLKQHAHVRALLEERATVGANAREAQARLGELASAIATLWQQNQQCLAFKSEADTLVAEQPRLRERMERLKERLDQLEEDGQGICPLCGQPLSDAHRQSVRAELQTDGEQLGSQFRQNKERVAELAPQVALLERALAEGPRLERDQRAQQQRLARAEARLEEIESGVAQWETGQGPARLAELQELLADETLLTAQRQRVAELDGAIQEKAALEEEKQRQQKQISAAAARLDEMTRVVTVWQQTGREALFDVKLKLETAAFASEAQHALAELKEQVATLAYDAAAHESARVTRDELAQAPERHQELKQAEAAVKPLEDGLADLAKQIADQEQGVVELRDQHASAAATLESISSDGGDVRGVEDELFRLREEQIAANRLLGAAQQKVKVLEDLRARQKKLASERAEVTQRIKRLSLLEKACGRNGVQALLIEQALPEIEERANDLLDRLTGGDMRVSFETQKQLKSREATVETLEIRIVDGAGERPYANFSGGEQFRINFAIRLALSQVLAKRAGAPLQTLVIDEGFGSQDPSGRQRLVEAINTIQEDFARILVITHIDELRDAFPTRIEVEKSVSGSAITVV
jgi:exonuclease SbcC